MAGNRFNAFQNHGVGIGLRIPHYEHIFAHQPAVDWFEIISEKLHDRWWPSAAHARPHHGAV